MVVLACSLDRSQIVTERTRRSAIAEKAPCIRIRVLVQIPLHAARRHPTVVIPHPMAMSRRAVPRLQSGTVYRQPCATAVCH